MKKYPFPPNVGSMSDSDYREHCANCATAEREAKAEARIKRERARDERAKAVAARGAERLARRARKAEQRATSPIGRVEALKAGESVNLSGYTSTRQLSSTLAAAYVNTGARYTSALAHDLLTGETVTGVTVTRTG